MISLQSVSKSYDKNVLSNVNLKVGQGEFLYVVGDSGAGKTTLLRLLYGEEKASQGRVEIFGKDLAKASRGELADIRKRIGVIFQDLRLIEEITARENVLMALETAPEEVRKYLKSKSAVEEALTLVGAIRFADKRVSELSGGEKQRIGAARAIVRQPELLIADEPTGSLDKEHTWGLMDIFQKLHLRGTTVLIATHDRDIVRRVRRRSCILASGKLVVEEGVSLL